MRRRQDPCAPKELPYDFRIERAEVQRSEAVIEQPLNNDRALSVDRSGQDYRTAVFSKTLPHNSYGEVEDQNWVDLEVALRAGEQVYFDRIKRSPGAVQKLANPQGALGFTLCGADAYSVSMPAAPSMVSEETAGEMIEVYGMALLRDESFRDLENGTTSSESIVSDLLTDLNALEGAFKGPKEGDPAEVTRGTLFRGTTYDETVGPYVSQFLLHSFRTVNIEVDQSINVEGDVAASRSVSGWLSIQNGEISAPPNFTGQKMRVYSPRTLGSYVHNDGPGSAFQHAAFILLQNGAPLSPEFSRLNERGFVTQGPGEMLTRLFGVAELALKAAWRQKWVCHMRLRPEVYAGRVHFTLTDGQDYTLDDSVLGAATTANILSANSAAGEPTYLLPLLYPEGSPTHPSYPAGHAVVAGACATLLKAFFDTDVLMSDLNSGSFPIIESVTGTETMADLVSSAITDPSVTSQMTVGSELGKLASNIATGRNMAGVHYRSDGDLGLILGEDVAIQYLRDVGATYNETFSGYSLTKFDGTTITITTD